MGRSQTCRPSRFLQDTHSTRDTPQTSTRRPRGGLTATRARASPIPRGWAPAPLPPPLAATAASQVPPPNSTIGPSSIPAAQPPPSHLWCPPCPAHPVRGGQGMCRAPGAARSQSPAAVLCWAPRRQVAARTRRASARRNRTQNRPSKGCRRCALRLRAGIRSPRELATPERGSDMRRLAPACPEPLARLALLHPPRRTCVHNA